MTQSGITIDAYVTDIHETLKKDKQFKIKYAVFRISDDQKKVIFECSGEDAPHCEDEWILDACFNEHCKPQAPRWIVVDCHFSNKEGQKREKVVMFSWIPDECQIKLKMLYASTEAALKSALDHNTVIQLKDDSDKDKDYIMEKLLKK